MEMLWILFPEMTLGYVPEIPQIEVKITVMMQIERGLFSLLRICKSVSVSLAPSVYIAKT